MLAGEAHIRSGQADTGLTLLLSAQADAGMFEAHRTIRSEIALNIGLAQYCRHDFAAADLALRSIEPDADLVYARGMQFRAWVAAARGNNEHATDLFVRALQLFDTCRHQDRYFEANCLRALAHIALERLDLRTWEFVSKRRAKIDWSFDALADPRFFVTYCAATYQIDVAGNAMDAAREARAAEQEAPTDAFRVQARCKRASIARQAGEHVAHRDHAECAAELFAVLSPASLSGDEKLVPLILAEQLASLEPAQASTLVTLHRTLEPMSPLQLMVQSPLGKAYRFLVEANVLEHLGNRNVAIRRYREALDVFKEAGYVRRAVVASLALWRLTGDRKFHEYASVATNGLPSQSFLRREVEAARTQTTRLTAVQREVLALICQGKSNPDIARQRNRSLHTIRNLVARLFEIFDVTSREELAVEGVRRGVYTPK